MNTTTSIDTIDDERKEYIEEYKLITQRWDNYAFQALVVKGWVSAAMLAGTIAFQSVRDERQPKIALVGFLLILTVWLFEAVWKSWQVANYERIVLLEEYFREETIVNIKPFQIYKSWNNVYGDKNNWKKVFTEACGIYVMLPYVVFAAICFFAFDKAYTNILGFAAHMSSAAVVWFQQ